MLKKLLSAIGIKDYLVGIVLNSLRLRNGKFDCAYFWFLLISIIYVDYIVTKDNKATLWISISAGITTIIAFLIAGYILYLAFDFIPKKYIINRILPIREKLNEILTESNIANHSFIESHEIEKINSIVKLKRVPPDIILEIWLYKLKMQRNFYLIISPFSYFLLITLYAMLQNSQIPWIVNKIEFFHKSPPLFIEIIKWAFIAFVITNETFNINVDISRIELLKGINKTKN